MAEFKVLLDGLMFTEGPRWHDGKLFFSDMHAHQVLAGAAHLVVVFIWAVVFVLCGQFGQLSAAFYTSAMLYTSLGTGDVAMSSSWKMLGPFETADGMLMFGVSTAIAISVIQLIVRTRFHDLPNL